MKFTTLLSAFIAISSAEKVSYDKMNYGPSFPFHFAVPVHDLELAKDFYGGLLGFGEGRSSDRW